VTVVVGAAYSASVAAASVCARSLWFIHDEKKSTRDLTSRTITVASVVSFACFALVEVFSIWLVDPGTRFFFFGFLRLRVFWNCPHVCAVGVILHLVIRKPPESHPELRIWLPWNFDGVFLYFAVSNLLLLGGGVFGDLKLLVLWW
jgi:hypothetical protein